MVKTVLAVLAATAATAQAGVCCCGYTLFGVEVSTSYQCSAYGSYSDAYVTKYYSDNMHCNGDNVVAILDIGWFSSCQDSYGEYLDEQDCIASSSIYTCVWNDAKTTALASAAVAAAVVAYAM